MAVIAELQNRGYSVSKGFYQNRGSLLYFVSGLSPGDASADSVCAASGLPAVGDAWPQVMGNIGQAFCVSVEIIGRPSPTKAWVQAKYSTINTRWGGTSDSNVEEFSFVEPEPMRIPVIFSLPTNGLPVLDYGPKESWPWLSGGRARFRRVVYANVNTEIDQNDLVGIARNVGKLLTTQLVTYRFVGGTMVRSIRGRIRMEYIFDTQAQVPAFAPGTGVPAGALSVPQLNPFQTYRMPTPSSPTIGVFDTATEEIGPMPGFSV